MSAPDRGQQFAEQFLSCLAGSPLAEVSTAALYLPIGRLADDFRWSPHLEQAGSARGAHGPDHPARAIAATIDVDAMGMAWTGDSVVLLDDTPDPCRNGLQTDEQGVAALAVRNTVDSLNGPPWGVLRLGIGSITEEVHQLLFRDESAAVYGLLSRAVLRALADAEV